MKNLLFLMAALFLLQINSGFAQKKQETGFGKIDSTKIYIVVKNDGTSFIGKIISMDMREVVMDTKATGEVAIPKNEIKEIKLTGQGDINSLGEYMPVQNFATRYFLTANVLPIKQGDSYIQWNLYGPDLQIGISDNLGVGLMTSWLGAPVIANVKYTIPLQKNLNLAVGGLFGTGSWAIPNAALALPFGSITFGNQRNNITLTAGYGYVTFPEIGSGGSALFSVAGAVQLTRKASLVFDSFIYPDNRAVGSGFALLMPGIRLQTSDKRALQFGVFEVISQGQLVPLPIPMIQWYQKI